MKARPSVVLLFSLIAFTLTAAGQKTRFSETPAKPAAAVPSTSAPASTAAPIPVALLNGKTVFVSNAGADSGLFPHPFSGTPARGYNQFYAALQAWGRYTLVADPSDADLIFQLQLTAPNGPQSANKVNGASDPLPMFRLVVLDRRSHVILWALTESIDPAVVQKTHDRNLDDALNALVSDLKDLLAPPSHP